MQRACPARTWTRQQELALRAFLKGQGTGAGRLMWTESRFQVPVTDVAHAIQLSLGPVFLLNGVGVLLAMLTSRLARIVDRARVLEARLPRQARTRRRKSTACCRSPAGARRLMNRAITLGTVAALLVALVVALLFATAFVTFPIRREHRAAVHRRDAGPGRLAVVFPDRGQGGDRGIALRSVTKKRQLKSRREQ